MAIRRNFHLQVWIFLVKQLSPAHRFPIWCKIYLIKLEWKRFLWQNHTTERAFFPERHWPFDQSRAGSRQLAEGQRPDWVLYTSSRRKSQWHRVLEWIAPWTAGRMSARPGRSGAVVRPPPAGIGIPSQWAHTWMRAESDDLPEPRHDV